MKILKYFLVIFFAMSMVRSQDTFTKEEALEMIKQRDAQWEDKIAKANTLIEFQKITIAKSDSVIIKLEEQAKLDTLVMLAQKKQIDLLKSRDEANEKMIDLVKKKWYENQYLWLGIGFILGKI
jgi:hypothetical protein|tara:strand:- start:330 stop:701 length:372 start_codon:yes stop_codon:yes gene_type:complete